MEEKQKPSKNRLTSVSLGTEVIFHIIIAAFSLACIIPFIFVVIISFTSEDAIKANGYSFFPEAWSVKAYTTVFDLGKTLWMALGTSVFITVLGTILAMVVTLLYSYALFRRDFKYRNVFTFICFFTMIFGGGLAPTYIVCKNILGMHNNYWALFIPMLLNPFNVIIMRTFFQSSVPEALIESASIDGSGEYRTLVQIVIPVSLPGIATVSLLNMLAIWNEWFLAQLYIDDVEHVPLQYLLVKMQKTAEYMARNSGKPGAVTASMPTESLRMALCVIIVIPIAFAYPFFQRYIIAGLTVGAVKG
ncbi:MAG: carbohydrate ABC transporter permease [Oscillospiraceae bacterium]|jgi:putative aldouronate transport system permease protein|nr:carbohydrate ABC transporter permease [Oscillospiraceae bacterium]